MKTAIKQSLIHPYSVTYQTLYYLHLHLGKILSLTVCLIISYPAIYYGYLYLQYNQNKVQLNTLENALKQQQNLLNSLQQHLKKQREDNPSFSQINQRIQHILNQHQVHNAQWQWSLDKYNQFYLTFNQPSSVLLTILHDINQLPNLALNDLSLTKLHQNKLVQFSATFTLLQ